MLLHQQQAHFRVMMMYLLPLLEQEMRAQQVLLAPLDLLAQLDRQDPQALRDQRGRTEVTGQQDLQVLLDLQAQLDLLALMVQTEVLVLPDRQDQLVQQPDLVRLLQAQDP